MVWETSQGIRRSFPGVVIRRNPQKLEGRKMAKKLENWTLTLDGRISLDWTVSLHLPEWSNDALSNEYISMSVKRAIRRPISVVRNRNVENQHSILMPVKIQEFDREIGWEGPYMLSSMIGNQFQPQKWYMQWSKKEFPILRKFLSKFLKISPLFNLIRISQKACKFKLKACDIE